MLLTIPLAGPVIELLADRVDRCIGFEAGIIIDEALLAELVEEVFSNRLICASTLSAEAKEESGAKRE